MGRASHLGGIAVAGAGVYALKADAMKEALVNHHHLIRETHYSEDTWHYQLLLGFTNPLED